MWGLNNRICAKLGLDKDRLTAYNLLDTGLSSEEQDAFLREYGNVENFHNIEWYDDVKNILELMDKGNDVTINSNTFTRAIVKVKREQLDALLGLPKNKVYMNIVGDGKDGYKRISESVDIFVDDNPHNILKSKAKLNIMLKQPWNSGVIARDMLKEKRVRYVSSLSEVMRCIFNVL